MKVSQKRPAFLASLWFTIF